VRFITDKPEVLGSSSATIVDFARRPLSVRKGGSVSTLCDARIQQNNEKAPPGAVASRLPGTHDVMQPRWGTPPRAPLLRF
jgi:hypothetical protein